MKKIISITIPMGFEKLMPVGTGRQVLPGGLVYLVVEYSRAIEIFIKGISHAEQN